MSAEACVRCGEPFAERESPSGLRYRFQACRCPSPGESLARAHTVARRLTDPSADVEDGVAELRRVLDRLTAKPDPVPLLPADPGVDAEQDG